MKNKMYNLYILFFFTPVFYAYPKKYNYEKNV